MRKGVGGRKRGRGRGRLCKQPRITGFWVIGTEPSALGMINNCTSAPLLPTRDNPPLGIAVVLTLFFLVVHSGLSQGDVHRSYFSIYLQLLSFYYL